MGAEQQKHRRRETCGHAKERGMKMNRTGTQAIETHRLTLRRFHAEDAEDMFRNWASDPEVTRFLTWEPHPDVTYTRDWLSFVSGKYRSGEFFDWAVTLAQPVFAGEKAKPHVMIGTCGFTSIDTASNSAEIGYVLNPSYQGRGYATEAVKRVLRFAFEELEFNRVEARYIIGNDRSRRVMDRAGMRFEGVFRQKLMLRGRYRDIGVCAILAEDFFRRGGL